MNNLKSFFDRVFWPVSASLNILRLLLVGIFLVVVGFLADFFIYGKIPENPAEVTTAGDYVIVAGVLIFILPFFVWTFYALFGKRES